ncbi:hypothetical protein Tco_0595177 [Tanacetum coccineum]
MLAVCEGRVPLDAFSSWASSFCRMILTSRTVSDLVVVFFTDFSKLIRRETPRIVVGCLLTPLAGCVPDRGIDGVNIREDFLLRKVAPLALPREGSPVIKLGCKSKCHCQTSESRDEVHFITRGACSARACGAARLMLLAAMCGLLLAERLVHETRFGPNANR